MTEENDDLSLKDKAVYYFYKFVTEYKQKKLLAPLVVIVCIILIIQLNR